MVAPQSGLSMRRPYRLFSAAKRDPSASAAASRRRSSTTAASPASAAASSVASTHASSTRRSNLQPHPGFSRLDNQQRQQIQSVQAFKWADGSGMRTAQVVCEAHSRHSSFQTQLRTPAERLDARFLFSAAEAKAYVLHRLPNSVLVVVATRSRKPRDWMRTSNPFHPHLERTGSEEKQTQCTCGDGWHGTDPQPLPCGAAALPPESMRPRWRGRAAGSPVLMLDASDANGVPTSAGQPTPVHGHDWIPFTSITLALEA